MPNLIVARTFSKAYGLANLRIGMLAGDARLIGFLRKVSSPYNVNGVALAVLPEALDDEAYLALVYHAGARRARARVRGAEGARCAHLELRGELRSDGHRGQAQGACAAMRDRGVLLRDRSADPGCDGYVRITIGVEEHVTRGIEALRELCRRLDGRRLKVCLRQAGPGRARV